MKSMTIRIFVALPIFVFAAIGAVIAATPAAVTSRTIVADGGSAKSLDEAWRVSSDVHVEVSNIRGRVQVRGWDRPELTLHGSLGSGSRLEISGSARDVTLRVKSNENGWFGNSGPKHDTTLIVQVPRKAELELNVISADADVAGVAGRSFQVEGISGDLKLESAADDADVTSVSGDVTLTASGDSMSRAHVQTVSGDIKADNLRGHIKLETVSGNIGAHASQVSELETGSVSGDADISVSLAKHARLHMESMSGDIGLTLPAALSANIEASTFSGSISSDYGNPQTAEHGPGSHLDTRVGDGDVQISAQTFSGDIRLRKGTGGD